MGRLWWKGLKSPIALRADRGRGSTKVGGPRLASMLGGAKEVQGPASREGLRLAYGAISTLSQDDIAPFHRAPRVAIGIAVDRILKQPASVGALRRDRAATIFTEEGRRRFTDADGFRNCPVPRLSRWR